MQRPVVLFFVSLILILQQKCAVSSDIKGLEKMVEIFMKKVVKVQLKNEALEEKISNLILQVRECDGSQKGGSFNAEKEYIMSENERLKFDIKRLTLGLQTAKRLRKDQNRHLLQLMKTVRESSVRLNETKETQTLIRAGLEHLNETMSQIKASNVSVWESVDRVSAQCLIHQGKASSENVTAKLSDLKNSVCHFHRTCSHWSEWSSCNPLQCGTDPGTRIRNRTCAECGDGSTDETEVRSCEESCCPSAYDDVLSEDRLYCFNISEQVSRSNFVMRFSFCNQLQGGRVPLIDSLEKQETLLKYLHNDFQQTYIAIDGIKMGGSWLDRDGNPLKYVNWEENHPVPGDECIMMDTVSGKWISVSCWNYIPSKIVCERQQYW